MKNRKWIKATILLLLAGLSTSQISCGESPLGMEETTVVHTQKVEAGSNNVHRNSVDEKEISAEGWEGVLPVMWSLIERTEQAEQVAFSNQGQWHYSADAEQAAAWALMDYLKEESLDSWELCRMYLADGILHVFVSTIDSYAERREVYYLVDEEAGSYVVLSDERGDSADGEGEYFSPLVWHSYWEWYNEEEMQKIWKQLPYEFPYSEDYCMDSMYWNWGAHAMTDYLYHVQPAQGITWELSADQLYAGSHGKIADLWYRCQETGGSVHLLVDVGNKIYVVVEVLDVSPRWSAPEISEKAEEIAVFQVGEERWDLAEIGDGSYEFFTNQGRWHYHATMELSPVNAVEQFAHEHGMEDAEWEIRRMYYREASRQCGAMVVSDTGRELFLLCDDGAGGVRFLILADIVKGDALEVSLENGAYSYTSPLDWTIYDGEEPVSTKVTASEEAYVFEEVAVEGSLHAMADFLEQSNYRGTEGWLLRADSFYVGAGGYLADTWFTCGRQQVHLVVDIWNKLYAVVEVQIAS